MADMSTESHEIDVA